jgi:uncharacterized protein DUF5681
MSGRSSDYQVGYGKPPQHTRFRKGQSGNPKGRPKGVTSLAQIATRIFNERVVIRENGERRSITKLEAALKQLANKAASGHDQAVREVLRLQAGIEAAATLPERRARTGRGPADVTIDQPPDTGRIALALLNVLNRGRAERAAEEEASNGCASAPEV